MGHGPSTSANATSTTRTSPGRNDSFINSHPDPQRSVGSISMQNGSVNEPPQTLRSKSYLSYRRSTASLSKIFQKKRWKKRRGSISCSFNMNENDIKVELMNVNTATEEELMTLHGVNRALARNIINHREQIDGFRKIEDLALVSGMGASKLDQIRPEICISRKKPGLSRASSKAPSIESIPSTAESTRMVGSSASRFMKLININSATMFDLMSVEGINQATAARILAYRERKGPYKCIDDLRRIGISRRLLSSIKINLSTEDFDSDLSSTISTNSPARPPRHVTGRGHIRSISVAESVHDPTNRGFKRMPSVPPPVILESPDSDLKIIYDLMSIKTRRPSEQASFNFSHSGSPAYRVATWNLQKLTLDKIGNPGVMEVIVRTILENGFSILALQEICNEAVLEKICDELNDPKLPHNREWVGYRGLWKFVLHESPMHLNKVNLYLGVLYDASKINEVLLPETKEIHSPIQNGSLWQFAVFKIKAGERSLVLFNVLSLPLESGAHMNGQAALNQREITDSLKSLVQETQGAMIVGFFSTKQAQKGLRNVEDLEVVYPNSEGDDNNAEQDESKPCSLWITKGLKQYLTGEFGVVEEGLTHLAIPDGWKWGGKVSQYGPLWCTIYDSPKSDEKDSSEDRQVAQETGDDSDDYVPVR